MKILLLYDGIYPDRFGGVERRNLSLARSLEARGHEVTLAGFVADPSKLPAGVKIVDLGRPQPLYDRSGRRRRTHAVRYSLAALGTPLEDFDVIETASLPLVHLPILASRARRRKIPLIVTWHEFWGSYWREHLGSAAWRAYSAGERYCARNYGDQLLTVSRMTADRLRKATGRPVTIVPNGIDGEAIAEAAANATAGPPFLYVGRLIPEKRVDLLLEAIARIHESHCGPLLTVIGSGPDLSRLKAIAARLHLEEAVVWKGHIEGDEDVWRAMGACRALVQPSAREGFGIVVLEAMAASRPVIYCDSPESAVGELIQNGINGIRTESDIGHLAEALNGALRGRFPLAQFGNRAKDFAQRFDNDSVAEAFEGIARGCVEKHDAA